MVELDGSNGIFKQALSVINNTDKHLFLSGKAGTGKTSFLGYLKKHSYKKMIIAAPTGVAAINAQGVTVHSLFHLPNSPYYPGSSETLKSIRFNSEKKNLIQELELLVIDEISMIRADTLDAIDYVLKNVRNQPELPFGGIQLLYVGDLFQLPPIVKQNEWEQLKKYYNSPFFIDSHIFNQTQPLFLELTKVYRQTNNEFVDLLNSIRNNSSSEQQLKTLNNYYQPDFNSSDKNYITLTTHNKKAEIINTSNLQKLSGIEYNFSAEIIGAFDPDLYPAEKDIKLKVGAQVMLLKNDKGITKKYFNGKIGTIQKIDEGKLLVKFDQDPPLELEKDIWHNIKYTYNEKNKNVAQEVIGTFEQYPIRLAWAITIHKSQGLTFENAVLDVEEAFMPGQVYVALSRVKSFAGLVLHSRITNTSISIHPRILEFFPQNSTALIEDAILSEKCLFIKKKISDYFEWTSVFNCINISQKYPEDIFISLNETGRFHKIVADKFRKELDVLLDKSKIDGYKKLDKRINTAAEYFIKEINEKALVPLRFYLKKFRNDLNHKRYMQFTKDTISCLESKLKDLEDVKYLARGLASSKEIVDLMFSLRKKST
jgi:hypothetical protein